MPKGRISVLAVLSLGILAATSSASSAQTVTGGFYRQANRPEVMFQFTATYFCHVQNESQMAAYGGFGKVRVVPQMKMAGRQTGTCGWPNGFYRRSNEPAVYRLYGPGFGDSICHVIDPQQMAVFGGFGQVKVVQPTSDLGRGRAGVTKCNPRAG